MAKKRVVDTVKQVLAGWTPSVGTKPEIYAPNERGDTPADGMPFIDTQYPVANTLRVSHSRSYVEEGAARLVIATPRGSGVDQAIQWGEELSRLFRSNRINGVDFKEPTSPLTHDDNDNGNYFKTSIVVPYHHHFNDPEP